MIHAYILNLYEDHQSPIHMNGEGSEGYRAVYRYLSQLQKSKSFVFSSNIGKPGSKHKNKCFH